MIHNHSSGKHSLLKKMLAVCIAFAMICSVSISAFSVKASSENTDETVQSVMTEETGDPEAAEAETDSEQTPGDEQTEEPEVTPPDENVENPDADNAEPTPSEDNEQPADPTVTEQPEEPMVTEEPEDPIVTPAEEAVKNSDKQVTDAKAGGGGWGPWPTVTPSPTSTPTEAANLTAAIYYLSTPDGVPGSNETQYWAPTSDKSPLFGKITTVGATWDNDKNIVSNVSSHVESWPDGTTNASWTVKSTDTNTAVSGKTYFNYILDSIWDAYAKTLQQTTGISDLTKSDVTEITLVPFKISRDNSTTTNQYYHIDCTINIVCKKAFTAKFWVKEPGATDYTQVDAKNYKTGDSVAETGKATIGSTKVVNGITYVLDGWYPENDAGGAYKDEKIANWNYTPNATELADGTVNFYAHYKPLYTSVNIKKLVTGNMGDKSKSFNFTVSVKNGNTDLSFKISDTSYPGSAEISLSDNEMITLTEVPVGATVTITEDDYSGKGYTTSYTIDSSASVTDRTATISNIQQLNSDKNAAHEVDFTNNKEAIPDTGLNLGTTPYILALGIAVLGAGFLIFGRRKRQS